MTKPKTHLIVTEKNIAAKRIANILSAKKKLKNVRVNGVDTYEFEGKDGDKNELVTIMGLSGHIVGLDFPKEYNNWQKVDAKNLIDAEIISKSNQPKIVSALKKLGKLADHVTIATDYDREGELIGVEALNIIRGVNPNIKHSRVLYSAITPESINNAFANSVKIDFNLADAGHSRQVIDLIWGASLTRCISILAGRLGKMFLSVGRVQSPTLALIVDREKERDAFIPEAYFELYAILNSAENDRLETRYKISKFKSRKEAEAICSKLGKIAIVSDIKKSERIDQPPSPFNTTEFIGAASSIGFSVANAMRIAESLYMNGFISYPRTDNTVYPATLDLREKIELFNKGIFKKYAEKLLKQKELTPTRGKKESTDHPPIHPASIPKKSELKEDEWRIYEMVVRRFFATFADSAIWESLKVKFDINGEEFRINGSRLIEPGWRWFYPYNMPKDKLLPNLEKGNELGVIEGKIVDKETKPPTRYGQARLIKLMEDLNLGTKATRHEIISKLYYRAYVHGNPLQPTKTAYAVVDTLKKYASAIVEPDMTSALENNMDEIATAKKKEDEVLKESRYILERIFSEMKESETDITESLRAGLREDKIIGTCKECDSKLMVRRSKKGSRFIGCNGYPDCNFALPLPKSGQIIVTDKLCEMHNIHHVKIITHGKKPWDLGCPHCNFIEWQNTRDSKPPKPKKLTDLKGIGKVTALKLEEAGIKNSEDLLNVNMEELSKLTGLTMNKIKKICEQKA
jgi:DNA topoisomerase-1